MNLTTTLMQSEWTKALGWTFVHSLWQIALIGLLLYMLLRLVPGRKAHTRYTISTLALWLIIIMALSTFMIMLPESTSIKEMTGKLLLVTTAEPLSVGERISAWLEVRMPMMLTIWSVGVVILMFRLIVSLAWVRHMRHEAIADADLQSALNQTHQLGNRSLHFHLCLRPFRFADGNQFQKLHLRNQLLVLTIQKIKLVEI